MSALHQVPRERSNGDCDRAMLRVSHLTAGYGRHAILEDASFALRRGAITGLVGANGAGKSTLVKTLTGLIKPLAADELSFDGQSLDHFRQRLGYMPQHTDVDWQFPATVADVVRMGRLPRLRWWQWPGRADREAATKALHETGMDSHARMPIGQLSGGQRQRTLLARTLVNEPDLLILDEPFAGVDAASQDAIMSIIRARRDDGAAVLLVHHNLAEVTHYCDDVVALGHGRVLATGPVAEALQDSVVNEMFGLPA
ncbi:metal ABC transporter ATP-binding protein [uncultured Corynebacterium sp.]|uniref:metal ABC transporter ATP-binding protein n=1 Tax=uncultured Corynebacterium sp. TaxID=159447 RepID=UPI0025F7A2A1|nr:metal ABC transporter ATP-binding protein [uncultured Corynebacterium sp.]